MSKSHPVHGVAPLALLRVASPKEDDDWDMTLLPGQLSREASREYGSADERIAFALLSLCVRECAGFRGTGKGSRATPQQQLKAIEEMRSWMADDASAARYRPGRDGFEYTFTGWCEILGVDDGYMKRGFEKRLDRWQREAEAQMPFGKRLKHILEEREIAHSFHQ